jgi:GNAT superfamily N-acetyltransferase
MRCEVKTRPVLANDIGFLADFWVVFTKAKQPGLDPDRMGFQEVTVNMMNSGQYVGLVATLDERIVGFIDGMVQYEPAYRANMFVARHSFVAEEHRGKGIGRKLYEAMKEAMLDRDCEYLLTSFTDERTGRLIDDLGMDVQPQDPYFLAEWRDVRWP